MARAKTKNVQIINNVIHMKIWVIYNSVHELVYTDHREIRKDMKEAHCQALGYNNWEEAAAEGHQCVRATLIVPIPRKPDIRKALLKKHAMHKYASNGNILKPRKRK